ncbi:MAG: hypothetical protein KDC53_04295 [Saprospiraceae bacterium]|nr:hypothetical protein [Saprospiraceae bacterium]
MIVTEESGHQHELFRQALILGFITVVYNIIEGVVSTYFGLKDETLTLFGFGADSFVETISALGVVQMIIRLRANPHSGRGPFEITALKITGWCFYALVAVLSFSALYNLYKGHNPASTEAGLIIALISILSMWLLIRAKIYVGEKLDSAPIIADARCNQVCLYMSVILLVASAAWELFHIPFIDIAGTAGLIYYSYKEGQEAFDKAKGIAACACENE